MKKWNVLFFAILLFAACKKEDVEEPINNSEAKLRLQFRFDASQERLNGIGEPATIAPGHATQSPDFNAMSAYFIELVPTKFTQIRDGAVIYEAKTQESEAGSVFENAVVFDEAIVSDEGRFFLEIPLKDIPIGTYEYLRASVTYQNADVQFNLKNLPTPLPSSLDDQKGTIAGFIGFNTHITDLLVKEQTIAVNGDRTQGFWAFEPQLDAPYQDLYTQFVNPEGVVSGQGQAGSTTVVNPLAAFGVELPFGSCIVTGAIEGGLTITGEEQEDLTATLSFSTNQSFEWIDDNGNGEWDFDVQAQTVELPVDMGLRGLKVEVE